MKKVMLVILFLIVFIPVIILGLLGFVPGLSLVLGTDKPRDLGIKYAEADLQSIRNRTQVVYTALADSSSPLQTRQFSGQRAVTAEFSSTEITATINNQRWKYWPYKNLQVRFNADGSGEISGVLIKNKVPYYAEAIGVPSEAIDFAMKYLPSNPVFYVKGKGALSENKVSVFEPQRFEIGRIPLPLGIFLSMGGKNIISQVYAQNINEMSQELSRIKDKKTLIINYINDRLSGSFGKFYAKKAYFGENKLFFDGTLSEKISYTP